MKYKKGSIFDILMLAIVLFALSLFVIFGYKIMTEFNTSFQANEDLSSNAKTHMSDLKGRYVALFDGIFITVLILLGFAIAVGVYYFDVHPVFYIPSLFIIIFTVIISGAFGNVFSDVKGADALESEASEFTLLPFVMDNFVKFIIFLSFIIVIVMYAKNKSGVEG